MYSSNTKMYYTSFCGTLHKLQFSLNVHIVRNIFIKELSENILKILLNKNTDLLYFWIAIVFLIIKKNAF